jgi:hypothetical protein
MNSGAKNDARNDAQKFSVMKIRFAILMASVGVACAVTEVSAQSTARPRPKDVQVVEEILPAAKVKDAKDTKDTKDAKDAKDEVAPDEKVTVIKKGTDRVEEFRSKGKVYKMRVTPLVGPAYVLMDEKGDGNFVRIDGPVTRMSVPMWVLFEW